MLNRALQFQRILFMTSFMFFLITGISAKDTPGNKTDLPGGLSLENNDDGYQPADSILDEKKVRFSGYGGPAIRFAFINSSLGLFTGGKGGMIVNDSLVIGGTGYGMILPDTQSAGYSQNMGYGGFLLEYIFLPKKVVNFTIGTMIGAGNNQNSTFFIIEPEINVFVNITRYFKIGISGSYRYTSGLNSGIYNDETFRGFGAGLVFEFGRF